MLAKQPGTIVCGHCRSATAEHECRACKRIVCDACAKDWSTCSEPVAQVLRLGVGKRLASDAAKGGPVLSYHGDRDQLAA